MDLAILGSVSIYHLLYIYFYFSVYDGIYLKFKFIDESTKDTKITVSSETILHGLKKFTNYSMEVLAFTAGGDGVRAPRIYCQTEQDGIDLFFIF